MSGFRSRLLFALISLITLVFLALGLILAQAYKSSYVEGFHEKLKMETTLISELLIEGSTQDPFSLLQRIENETETSVTVLKENGQIWYESEQKPRDFERHDEILEEILVNSKRKDSDLIEIAGGYDFHYYWEKVKVSQDQQAILVVSTEIDELKRTNRTIWWILFLSLGLSLSVIILLGTRITARYTKPIESATKVAIELAKGNYRARTYENRLDETGMLSTSINILARNLQETIEAKEIQQEQLSTLIENMGSGLLLIDEKGMISLVNKVYKDWFEVDSARVMFKYFYEAIPYADIHKLIEDIFMIEEPIRRQVQLQHTLEFRHYEVFGAPIIGNDHEWKGTLLIFHDISDIKRLEQMRKDFVANVSHELKTPITSIRGFSETLLDGAMNDEDTIQQFLQIIHKESDRLQSLIQDLLDLSRIEQSGFTLTLQEFKIEELVQDVMAILKPKAGKKEIDLTASLNLSSPSMVGDPLRIKQILINLINNAITYTPSNGKVDVSVNESEDAFIFTVKDTGNGIEEKELSRIFERFYRVDRARSRNSGGTGLGLAIVKHLVEAHKGKIHVDSKIGIGTTFNITIPKEIK